MTARANPIAELLEFVERHPDASMAVDALASCLSDSGRGRAQVEKTLDVLRRAFRKHVASLSSTPNPIICSFCKKTQEEVEAVVVASDASICDECARLTIEVIEGRAKKSGSRSGVGGILNLVARVGRGSRDR